MLRGIERRVVFIDDEDRRDFVARLECLVEEESFLCFAWALMPNHVHLLLKTGPFPLRRLMARLGTGYALRFNRRHERVGHLFQNRYKSILVERESHLHALVPYVHANPLRAGLVRSAAELEHYPWTGHAALLGHASNSFLSTREVLSWFGARPPEARRVMRALMEGGPAEPSGNRPEDDPDSRSLPGPPRDAGAAQPSSGPKLEPNGPPAPETLEALLEWVCSRVGTSVAEVRSGRRTTRAVQARSVTAHLAATRLGVRGMEISRFLRLDSGSTSRAATRGQQLLMKIETAGWDSQNDDGFGLPRPASSDPMR